MVKNQELKPHVPPCPAGTKVGIFGPPVRILSVKPQLKADQRKVRTTFSK